MAIIDISYIDTGLIEVNGMEVMYKSNMIKEVESNPYCRMVVTRFESEVGCFINM